MRQVRLRWKRVATARSSSDKTQRTIKLKPMAAAVAAVLSELNNILASKETEGFSWWITRFQSQSALARV